MTSSASRHSGTGGLVTGANWKAVEVARSRMSWVWWRIFGRRVFATPGRLVGAVPAASPGLACTYGDDDRAERDRIHR